VRNVPSPDPGIAVRMISFRGNAGAMLGTTGASLVTERLLGRSPTPSGSEVRDKLYQFLIGALFLIASAVIG
jgi:hypothetical protein